MAEPCREKPRLVQLSLEDFPQQFPKKKCQPQPGRPGGSPLVGLFDYELLQKKIFSFLTVQDLTMSLAASCRWMASQIDHHRGPLPVVVREEVLPEKFVYASRSRTSARVYWSQTIRFLLKTSHHRIV
jgi:hypothetical protein